MSRDATFSPHRLELQEPPPIPVTLATSSKLVAPLSIAFKITWSLMPLQMQPGFIRAMSSFSVIIVRFGLFEGESGYE